MPNKYLVHIKRMRKQGRFKYIRRKNRQVKEQLKAVV